VQVKEHRISKSLSCVLLVLVSVAGAVRLHAQASSDEGDKAPQSWSSTTEQRDTTGTANSTRTSISHKEDKSGTTEKRTVERLGDGGQYQPYLETERQSTRVNANTTKTVERTYGRDANGNRQLVQVTQSEVTTSPDGGQKAVRTTMNPDVNGGLQTVRREIEDSRPLGSGVQETKTTVLSPDASGSLVPIQRTLERQTQSGENAVKFHKETSSADLNGGWQLNEIREGSITKNGSEKVKEENVLRPNVDGTFSVAERKVSKESDSKAGDSNATVEWYSTSTPGVAGDGALHLNERVTTRHVKGADGREVTQQQVEQRNAGNPGDRFGVTQQSVQVVRTGANGTTQTSTVQSVDANGNMGVVWVDMGKSDKSTIQVDTAPGKTASSDTKPGQAGQPGEAKASPSTKK
jgi:hypothetical protein